MVENIVQSMILNWLGLDCQCVCVCGGGGGGGEGGVLPGLEPLQAPGGCSMSAWCVPHPVSSAGPAAGQHSAP